MNSIKVEAVGRGIGLELACGDRCTHELCGSLEEVEEVVQDWASTACTFWSPVEVCVGVTALGAATDKATMMILVRSAVRRLAIG